MNIAPTPAFRLTITHTHIPLCIRQDTGGNAKQRCHIDENRTTIHLAIHTVCTLFASEIDDCLWICCFSCPFNQMALNDDRDLR